MKNWGVGRKGLDYVGTLESRGRWWTEGSDTEARAAGDRRHERYPLKLLCHFMYHDLCEDTEQGVGMQTVRITVLCVCVCVRARGEGR